MIHHATCNLCEAACGLDVEVERNQITAIRGDRHDPWSQGFLCPKGAALGDVHADPARVRVPLRRRGERWFEVGWDEALDEAAQRIAEIRQRHGRDAVALYLGNPVAHSYTGVFAALALAGMLDTRNRFTANSVDGHPRLLMSLLLYGSPLALPIVDIDRTDFLLVIGANPVVSNGSQMTAPDCKRRLSAIRARGGKVIVIDPRRTETAALADRHHFIVPGTDALLLAALVRTILDENLANLANLAELAELATLATPRLQLAGVSTIAEVLRPYSPERVAPITGIGADEIRLLARAFAAAPRAACYGRLGVCTQEYGTIATWLIDVLSAITGNLDREGGSMFPKPAIDLATIGRVGTALGVIGYDRYRSRVRGLPELVGELPVATLADEIETPGDGQIRALVTYAGNPVMSCPSGARLDRAIASLEFRVAIDIYRNETTRHADLILPTTFGFEHDHHPLLFHGMAVRNGFKLVRRVVEPPSGLRDDWQVVLGLAARIGARGGLAARAIGAALRRAAEHRELPNQLLRFAVRASSYRLDVDAPHGTDLGPLTPRLHELLGKRSLQLAPQVVLDDLPRLAARLDRARDAELVLVGRRHLRSNNSWMHNVAKLVRGKHRCTLLVHPDDAAARGIRDGELVHVRSRVGVVALPAQFSDAVMRGVVCMPHGWSHASMNDLTDDIVIDVPSGCAALSGVRVTLETAAARAAS